jgi:hypothetical protein
VHAKIKLVAKKMFLTLDPRGDPSPISTLVDPPLPTLIFKIFATPVEK